MNLEILLPLRKARPREPLSMGLFSASGSVYTKVLASDNERDGREPRWTM